MEQKDWFLFRIFFVASTFTFGGGMAMLPVLKKEIVAKKLMHEDAFLDAAVTAQSLPGIIAVNCACLVGQKVDGVRGMLIAGLGAMIPTFVFMLVATILLRMIPMTGAVLAFFTGVRAAAVSFVFAAALTLGKHVVKDRLSLLVVVLVFVFSFLLQIDALWIILVAILLASLEFIVKRRNDHVA